MGNRNNLFHASSGLIGVICGPSIEDARKQVQKIKEQVDGIELRLDLFHDFTPDQIAPLMQLPTIITWKVASLEQLKEMLVLSPVCIDLDASTPRAVFEEIHRTFPSTKIICSTHDFDKTPDNLGALLESIQNPCAHFYKIACMARSTLDALRMLKFVQKTRCVGLCMGDKGSLTRQLAPIVGTPWMYAAALKSASVAPGQLTVDELKNTYRFSELSRASVIYALIGNPTAQSPSHKTHNPTLKELGENAVYVKIALEKGELPSFFSLIADLPFKGFSVTIPFKESLFSFVDVVDPKAAAIGAINTLVSTQGTWHGYNTDAAGALDAIEKKMSVANKRLLILGAGGSAKAIAFEALQRGAHVTIQNRTASKALGLAQSLGCKGMPFTQIQCDILINTTSVHMPIPQEWIAPETVVMDLYPGSKLTPLLTVAKEKGCTLISGFEMFLLQAAEQFALWFPESIET